MSVHLRMHGLGTQTLHKRYFKLNYMYTAKGVLNTRYHDSEKQWKIYISISFLIHNVVRL